VVVEQGARGRRFHVVADGTVEVVRDGRVVNELGRGDGFGEIALLYDVPRTAACIAVTRAHLYALVREDFVSAVTRHPHAALEAHRLAAARLGSEVPGAASPAGG
jgi:CRP-like cAMP-binding protein